MNKKQFTELLNKLLVLRGFYFRKILKKTELLTTKYIEKTCPLFTVNELYKNNITFRIINASFQSPSDVGIETKQNNRKKTINYVTLPFLIIAYFHIIFIAATSLTIFLYKWVTPVGSTLELVRKYKYHYKVRVPIPVHYKQVPLYIRSMLIAVEDYKFYTHHGFDIDGIKRAIEINTRIKKPLYGGSTLSMQLARTLFLTPAKSYLRKYLEAIITVELELILSKNRILELYFSLAEWGKGIFGIEQASLYYYKHKIKQCTRDESARLIALLSSPILYTPYTIEKNRLLSQRYYFLYSRYCK
ncbi:MAG TPA: biosynthetic peptidoglycan transglycosylase [Spirochaetia bacterium]|nr:biosynthetic peptidoglycan transglycosylase [Spirochaetales bacterium]HPD81338.1 biosynthetic peptidoglycan transglycosylase [Spirochaetales bacterium]HRS64649.1 biosynthetic peptidoglycan transglycosylase [Spirochaetia bacterium]HRV28297.1 biosynthetic peptidoglycan transglycosylase [Spirochaetia bacterium]